MNIKLFFFSFPYFVVINILLQANEFKGWHVNATVLIAQFF